MRMGTTRPGLTGHVSEHRFRLALPACAPALAAMLTAFHGAVGFAPLVGAAPAVPAAS